MPTILDRMPESKACFCTAQASQSPELLSSFLQTHGQTIDTSDEQNLFRIDAPQLLTSKATIHAIARKKKGALCIHAACYTIFDGINGINLNGLIVPVEYRQGGLGVKLTELVLAYLAKKGEKSVNLVVRTYPDGTINEGAYRTFQKAGFVDHGPALRSIVADDDKSRHLLKSADDYNCFTSKPMTARLAKVDGPIIAPHQGQA